MNESIAIFCTVDYDRFQHYPCNRNKMESHVIALMNDDSFIEGQKNSPIVVNKTFHVIDGQHRLEACKRLEIPVWYMIDPEATEDDIRLRNAGQRAWLMTDYIHHFSHTSSSYKFLMECMEKFKGLNFTGILSAICQICDLHVYSLNSNLKQGKFQLTKDQMNEATQFLQEFTPFLKEIKRVKGKEASPFGYQAYIAGFCLLFKNDYKLFKRSLEKALITNMKPPYYTLSEDAFKYLMKLANWRLPRTFTHHEGKHPSFESDDFDEVVNG